MKSLTPRQKVVFEYIKEYILNKHYAPSFREIQQRFDFASLASVHKYVCVLKKKGALQGESRSSRSLTLSEGVSNTSSDKGVVDVVFMGYLSEKSGIETLSQMQRMQLPKLLVAHPDRTLVLRVKGSFLEKECIVDGDLLLIETQPSPVEGAVILLQLSDKSVLFKVLKEINPQQYHVQSAHQKEPVLIFSREQATLLGVVSGVLRLY